MIPVDLGYVRPEKCMFVREPPPTENLAYALLARAPELPSTANDRHRQPPANMKLARAFNPRATHENTLVMRSSLSGDED